MVMSAGLAFRIRRDPGEPTAELTVVAGGLFTGIETCSDDPLASFIDIAVFFRLGITGEGKPFAEEAMQGAVGGQKRGG